MNSRSDTGQLLGCFEQTAQDIDALIASILQDSPALSRAQLMDLKYQLRKANDKERVLREFAASLDSE